MSCRAEDDEWPLREHPSGADTAKMHPLSPAGDRRRPAARARSVRIAGKALIGAFLGAGLLVHIDLLRAAWRELRAVSLLSMVALLAGAVLHRGVHAVLVGRSTPGLRWHRAVLVSEAHAGCANSMVGGAAVGTGVKAAMLRSYGLEAPDIATSIVATGAVPSIAMWLLALVNTGPRVLAGTATPLSTTVAAVSLAAFVGQIVFWWVSLVHPAPARRAGSAVDRIVPKLRRCCRGPLRPMRRHLHHVEGRSATEAVRVRGLALLRTRGATLLTAGVVAQLTLAMMLVLSLRAVGGDGAAPLQIIEVFAVARVAASFVPVPGGVGILDVGLFTGLVGSGVSNSAALAALVVYRAITFVLPMVTGMVSIAWWRRVERRRPAELNGQLDGCSVPSIDGQLASAVSTAA